MFQSGETYALVADTADVATVIPSSQSAFVMATAMPTRFSGSLVQGSPSPRSWPTPSLRTPTIPIDIEITSASGTHSDKGAFHTEIMDNKFLTPTLAGAAVMNAIQYYLPDRDDVTARVESTIRIKGLRADLVRRLHVQSERRRRLGDGQRARPCACSCR